MKTVTENEIEKNVSKYLLEALVQIRLFESLDPSEVVEIDPLPKVPLLPSDYYWMISTMLSVSIIAHSDSPKQKIMW